MIAGALRHVARHGKLCLVLGLVVALAFPSATQVVRPHIVTLIWLLLLLTAVRIGAREAIGSLTDIGRTVSLVVIFQLFLPFTLLAPSLVFGVADHPLVFAMVFLLAAPSVTGAPNLAILLGHAPAPAMRLLIVGTALFPLTILPVLWATPVLGSEDVVFAGLKLFGMICAAAVIGFALRAGIVPELTDDGKRALDGAAAILLATVVLGLMSALGPALKSMPSTVAYWAIAAFVLNAGLQVGAKTLLGTAAETPARAIVAGNRNIALMLVALPEAAVDSLLIFIGCYQIPMYLTPILMTRLYRDCA